MNKIKLEEIPWDLFPLITDKGQESLWYRGLKVLSIFPFKGRIRISTTKGEYRVDLISGTVFDIY